MKARLSREHMVIWIKAVHMVLFWAFTLCVVLVAYAAVTGETTVWTWGAIVLVVVEGLVLMARRWVCPLTDLAEHYGAETGSITQYFMPQWLSDWVFQIWGVIFVVSVLVIAGRVMNLV